MRASLKALVPINTLNREHFEELAAKTAFQDLAVGNLLFNKGDLDRKTIYLIEGEVRLVADKGSKTIKAGSEQAKHPLANHQPRICNAVAKTASKIALIDSDLLDLLLTWDQLSGIEVNELAADQGEGKEQDWMTRILQSKSFLRIPPANIQALFMRLQEVPVKKGMTVIKQGQKGSYYYIIKHGKCKITRNSKVGSELALAHLHEGDAFGEEALLSGSIRNANVTMIEDGVLMRLSKKDFDELLKAPMLNWVTGTQARQLLKEGAKWIDVRLESEHKNNCIKGSLNISLFMLRLKADALDPNIKYILYCDSGHRSSAGAFILGRCGLNVYCLKGGLVEYDP